MIQSCPKSFITPTLTALWLLFILTPAGSFAEEAAEQPVETSDEEECYDVFPGGYVSPLPPPEPEFLDFLDTPRKVIAGGLGSFVKGVDEFFADEQLFYTSSGSYIRLTLDTVWNEGGEIGYRGEVRIKVRLPTTQKKLKLLLESDPAEKRDPLDRRTETSPAQAVDNREYYAGVQQSFGELTQWHYDNSIGLRLRQPLDPYIRLRAERDYPLDNWLMKLNGTAYWFDSSGTGYDGNLEFNRKISDDMLFRDNTFIRYTAQTDYFYMSEELSIVHSLSDRRAVTYVIGAYGISEPTVHVTDYIIAARYRQNLHKNYFFMDISPELRFSRANNFTDQYSLFIRFELLFQD